MKGNTGIFVSLALLLCWEHVDSTMPMTDVIELNMAVESVDDMYDGCDASMQKRVEDGHLREEVNVEPFKTAWRDAEECAGELGEHEGLTKDHLRAICAYTDDHIYEDFNTAVRTGKKSYGSSSFGFHSLHFLLTSAVQILNQQSGTKCHNTLRRSDQTFTGKIDRKIRFGSFASSSYKRNLTDFGTKTCFMVKTCAGAFLKQFSAIPEEDEVLIPPYEMFIINKIVVNKKVMKMLRVESCEVLYVLESAGTHSNLNCKLVCE